MRTAVRAVVVLLVAFSLLAALPLTELGTRWLVASVVALWTGDRLHIGKVSGRLAQTVRLQGLEFRDRSLDLSAKEVALSFELARLLDAEIHLKKLAMNGVELALHDIPAAPDEVPAVALPVTLAAPAVAITDITVIAGGEEIPVESVTLSASLGAAELRLAGLDAAGASWRLTANGAFAPVEPYAVDLHAQWESNVDGAAQGGSVAIAGDVRSLDFDAAMEAPVALKASGRLRRAPRGYEISATGAWRDLQWPLFAPPSVRSPQGRFEIGGALDEVSLSVDFDLEAEGLPATRLTLRGTGSIEASPMFPFDLTARWRSETASDSALVGELDASGNRDEVLVRLNVLTPFVASSEAALTLGDEPEFEAAAQWSGLFWPLSGKRLVASPEGRLEAKGSAAQTELALAAALEMPERVREGRLSATATLAGSGEPALTGSFDWDAQLVSHDARLHGAGTYALNGPWDALEIRLDGTLEGDVLPPARVTLTGNVRDTGLDLEPLLIHALGGRLTARGRIGWRPEIDWKLSVDARGLDPGRQWPQWDGALGGAALVQGRMVDGVARTEADVQFVEGHLRGHPVEAFGKLEIAGERLQASGVSLRSGDNRLELDGVYEHGMDLRFSLEAADLRAVLPDADGGLTGEGVVKGSIASPHVKVRLEGRDVRYRNWSARRLALDTDVSDAQATSRVLMRVENAHAGELRIESMELRGQGRLASHSADVAVRSNLGDLDLRLAGGLEDEHWQGELVDTTIVAPGTGIGTWRLAKVAALSADADRVRVERTCLESEAGASACADFEWTDHARSSIDIDALPLSALQAWLPARSTVTGELDIEARWSLSGGHVEGSAAARLSPGELTVVQSQFERLVVAHADTELNLRVEEGGAAVDFRSALGGDGRVQGNLVADGLHEDAALAGAIEASFPQLEPVAALFAPALAMDGRAHMEVQIGGSVASPRATGVARVEVERARVLDLGIELSDSRVEARADGGQRVAVYGVLRSGDGHLDIDASGRLEAGGWTPKEMTVTGESFEIVRLPEAVVTVSPDVTVNALGESLELNGRVVVPRARFTVAESSEGAVGVSGDEVLVDRTGNVSPPDGGRGPPLSADLVVVLGDDVVFDGFGVLSRLAGELRVRHAAGGVPEAFGTLDLVDGRLVLYGQRLDIEHGSVTFAGPLNDPGLDIRTVRKAGDVTAGVSIGGTVSSPRSRIFSEPPLDEAEVLSLLLTGHSLSSGDERQAALLSQAALNLGLEGSERVGARIQSALGLDELIVGGMGEAGDASLILGKRLNSDLGVRYVHWFARQAGSVFVNYRLNDHLSLEAESGVRQGLDLLLRVERDDASK